MYCLIPSTDLPSLTVVEIISQPHWKSGPAIILVISEIDISGFFRRAIAASITSSGLCDGRLQANPTAIASGTPLIRATGHLAGRYTGSTSVLS